MQLKEFSFISPVINPGELFTAIETAIPPEAIEQAIGKTNSFEERNRVLPSHLVVSLVVAMSLWSTVSIRTVLKHLVDGLSTRWTKLCQYWKVPCRSSITEARQRVGPRVMSQLFAQVVRPLATEKTPGAFLRGLRVMALDGTVLDVPDTEANAPCLWLSRHTPWYESCLSAHCV